MEFLTLKEVIDQIEGILGQRRKTRKDIERAQEYLRSAREFLAFDRRGLAAPPVICPDTLEVYEDGTISCLESRRVVRAAMDEPGGSSRKLASGLSYDDQVIFCEMCQKICADTLARLEEELERLL